MVARYVDEQIRRVADTQLTTTILQLALVAALNIASDYWKLQHQQQEADKMVIRMVQRMGAEFH
jgi:cell division protein ZapA (FtsZ GTPase activity inhibitor)